MKQASILKTKLIKLSAKALNFVNGFPFSLIYRGKGQILMLHRVLPSTQKQRIWSNSFLEITPEFLENIILYYKNLNYNFLSLSEFYKLNKSSELPTKFVIFTFDDGYKDNLNYAFPILSKHNIPFTIYITTDFADQKAKLWWYALETKLLDSESLSFSFLNNDYFFEYKTINERNNTFEKIHQIIKTTSDNNIDNLLSSIFSKKELTQPLENVLNWEDIIFLAKQQNVSIGAHTLSHRPLISLSKKESYREIKNSIDLIENKINKPVEHFALPYGGTDSYSKREICFLQKLEIKTNTTTISKNLTKKSLGNLLELPRIACGMSMAKETFDLMRHGVIPMIRNKFKL